MVKVWGNSWIGNFLHRWYEWKMFELASHSIVNCMLLRSFAEWINLLSCLSMWFFVVCVLFLASCQNSHIFYSSLFHTLTAFHLNYSLGKHRWNVCVYWKMANVNCKENTSGIIIIIECKRVHYIGLARCGPRHDDRRTFGFHLSICLRFKDFVCTSLVLSISLCVHFSLSLCRLTHSLSFVPSISLFADGFHEKKTTKKMEDVKGIRIIEERACALVYLENFIN